MNKICSDANSIAIRNVYECKIAAEILGYHDNWYTKSFPTRIENDNNRPTGCYYWKGNNGTEYDGVRYNRLIHNDQRNAEASPLCQNG